MWLKLRFLLFILFVSVTAGFLLRKWDTYRNIPKNYEWNAVDSFLKGQAASDDLLFFEPPWLAGYAQDHGRLRPYSVVTPREIFKKTFPPSSRLWLISMLQNPSVAARLKSASFVEEGFHEIDSVRLRLYQIPSRDVFYDFTHRLSEAQALVDYGDGNVQKGEWKNGAWVFNDNPVDWNQISLRSVPFRGQIRRCIWFHPLEGGVKTLSFSAVPLGSKIRILGGIVDSGLSTPPGDPVFLFIRIGGKRIEALQFKDTDSSFEYEINLTGLPAEERNSAKIVFELQTAHQTRRHFCFSAWSET